MAVNDILHENDRVVMVKTTKTENQINRSYASRIYTVIDNDRVEIYFPRGIMNNTTFSIGERFKMLFQTDRGMYSCIGVITDRYKPNGVYVIVIRIASELEKMQRRQYFRVDCLMDIEYRYNEENKLFYLEMLENEHLSQTEREKAEKQVECSPSSWRKATAVDISGGGIRFNCREAFDKGTRLDIKFYMQEIEGGITMVVPAKVVECRMINNRGVSYEARIEFAAVHPKDREKIIRYVFERERSNRKKSGEAPYLL